MRITSTSPYLTFSRDKWAELRNSEPMTLSEEEIVKLKGINEELSMDEIRDSYLPLSRLLNNYVNSTISRREVMMRFLNEKSQKVPFIIGIAGSVSVGKSTFARVLQALLSRWKENYKVALVTTDGFLYPNAVLEEKGIMSKKGFPESYDIQHVLQFLGDIKSGKKNVRAPKYSHLIYDIVPNEYIEINPQPDILIFEGLNVLQSQADYPKKGRPTVFVSDYLDFSIYVDADDDLLEDWFITRFMKLRETAFNDPSSYFFSITKFSEEEAGRMALSVWREINKKNLHQNILPTRERANLILHKGEDHKVDYVKLRK
ncbi:MAG: type I pantothenate kinase [Dysgonamonadaceae bacterium]|jgi:type I pantothenate kinase|nr:type I pantothenate kinase [Dysgonamonadaceae bacterium]